MNPVSFWDAHARADPLWAVLSDPAKRGRTWQLQEFMKNGEREISLLMYRLSQLGVTVRSGVAVDFGCGVGRLTQALARRFDRVIGLDISPAMIEIATRINRYPGVAEYRLNVGRDLSLLPAAMCDFIYSNIALQHIQPDLSIGYVDEFFRLLKPGGVLVFQLPSHQEPHRDLPIHPMPDAAYRAAVSLVSAVPRVLAPESECSVAVEVVNSSDHEWRQPDVGSIRIGNHWLDASGALMLIQDDGRTPLPQALKPGEACRLTLPVTAPSEPGTYTLAVDVVHEGVSWFEDKGSPSARAAIRVAADVDRVAPPVSVETMREYVLPAYDTGELGLLAGEPGSGEQPGEFPMYGVPQAEVLSLIGARRGTVVDVEDDGRAGPEWVGYRYFVTVP